MAARIDTPFTNEHFVAYCLKMVGHPYWYGTCGYKATHSLLARKTKQYPAHYSSSRIGRYQQDIANKEVVSDCIGGVKGYAWTGGGQRILEAIGTDQPVPSSYGSHGCPDYGANGMFAWAKKKGCSWGTIDTLPEVPGLALYKDGHAGYYVGDGNAVEWQGFSSGCVQTKVKKRPWTHWYALPFLDYGEANMAPMAIEMTLGTRLLKKGSAGADVKALQEILVQLGYDVGAAGADSKFGSHTEKAVKAFQRKTGLTVDGKYGDQTHAALMAAVGDEDAVIPKDEPISSEKTEQPAPSKKVVIISQGGKVNIRVGNAVKFSRISLVAPGTSLDYVATAENGWNAVLIGDRVGWVSGEYSHIIT